MYAINVGHRFYQFDFNNLELRVRLIQKYIPSDKIFCFFALYRIKHLKSKHFTLSPTTAVDPTQAKDVYLFIYNKRK